MMGGADVALGDVALEADHVARLYAAFHGWPAHVARLFVAETLRSYGRSEAEAALLAKRHR